jgi:hypothetical protein
MQLLVFIKETLNYKSHTINVTGLTEYKIFNHSKSLEYNRFFSLTHTHTHTHTHKLTHTQTNTAMIDRSHGFIASRPLYTGPLCPTLE